MPLTLSNGTQIDPATLVGNTPPDPAAFKLMQIIQRLEGGNYQNRTGDAGASAGAFQWNNDGKPLQPGQLPSHWQQDAGQFLGDANAPMTPENQNFVAYQKIKSLKDQGRSPEEIDAIWNGAKKDPTTGAYTHISAAREQQLRQLVLGNQNSGVASYGALPAATSAAPSVSTPPAPSPSSPPNYNTYGATFPAQPNESLPTSLLKEVGNVPSSIWNLGKGLLNVVQHPLETAKGVGNFLVGGGEQLGAALSGGPQLQNTQTATFNAVADALKERYGSLDNAKRTMENDPVGVIVDVSAILAGVKGLTGIDVPKEIQKVIAPLGESAAGQLVGKGMTAVQNIASAPLKLMAGVSGAETGTGYTPITEGAKASFAGGNALDAYTQGLRGNTSPEQLVSEADNALNKIIQARGDSYRQMLASLSQDPTNYETTPILDELDNQLSKFHIASGSDGLDFSRSTFALDTTAQRDIQNLYDYVKGYGFQAGDRTALGLDNLKKVLGGYYSPNSDYRAFVQGLKGATSGVLENAPGYTDQMKAYADATDSIEQTQKALSLGGTAALETSFKKLISALKNNDFRMQTLSELDNAAGTNLIAKVAGQRLSSITPRGLAPYIETIGGIQAVPHLGILPILGLAFTTSPRLVGEFLRAAGIATNKIGVVMNLLSQTLPSAAIGGGLMNRLINPSVNPQSSP